MTEAFAALALRTGFASLAVVGLYSVVSYAVSCRSQDEPLAPDRQGGWALWARNHTNGVLMLEGGTAGHNLLDRRFWSQTRPEADRERLAGRPGPWTAAERIL